MYQQSANGAGASQTCYVYPYAGTQLSTARCHHGVHVAKLSIKSRLLVMLLGVSAISIAIVASLSYYASYNALRDSVFKQLTSLRAIKAQAVETYFEALELEAGGIAEGPAAQQAAEADGRTAQSNRSAVSIRLPRGGSPMVSSMSAAA